MKKIVCSVLILTLLFSMTFPQMVFAGESQLQNKVAESQKEEIKRVTNKKVSIENERYSGDFGYRTLEDGTVEITSYSGNTEGDLILPDKLDEKPVTSIGNGAFSGYKFKGNLIIPDSVISIGAEAFRNCGFGGTLMLPQNLQEIGEYAFYGCDFTGNLTIPDSVTSIEMRTFSGCGFDGTLTLPKNLREIGTGAFSSCNFTGNLDIPDGVRSIGESAFSYCDFSGDIIIPESVEFIGAEAFSKAHNQNILGDFILTAMPKEMDQFALKGSSASGDFKLTIGKKIGIGQTKQGKVLLNGMRLSHPIINKWSSSDSNIAKIDQNGWITGVSTGDVTIQAQLYNGKYYEFPLTIINDAVEDPNLDIKLNTTPEIEEFQNLFVGDIVYLDGYEENSKVISNVEIIKGQDQIELLPDSFHSIKCTKDGIAKILVHFKEKYNVSPYEIQLKITERSANKNPEFIPNKTSLKLGAEEGSFVITAKNILYGSQPCILLDAADVQKFSYRHPEGAGVWATLGTWTRNLELNDQHLQYLKIGNDGSPFLSRSGIPTIYPGTITMKYYLNKQDIFNGEDPYMTSVLTIEDPIIETNAKKEYKEGQSLEFKTTLSNTAYRDIPFDQVVREWLYYTPKIEILSGTDCCEWVGEASKTTLSFSQKLKFIKAGTITLKVTYIPSGEYQSEDRTRQPYQPEKILTIQVKDPSATTVVPAGSVTLNKSNLRLKQGQSSRLTATVSPSNATNQKVVWTSSNSRVATVNNGTVTAKGPGTAVIKATAADGSGKSASCTITVAYNITYGLNGGKNHKANPTSYYKQTFTLKPPAREKYLFQGWYTDKWHKKRITKITSNQTGNLTLYAKWKKVYLGKGKLTSLKNKKGRKLVVKCKSVSGAGGYQIVTATNRKFRSNKKTITTTKRTATLKKLKKRTYYVKVRAYRKDSTGKKIYGKYSSVKKVKVRR